MTAHGVGRVLIMLLVAWGWSLEKLLGGVGVSFLDLLVLR